MTSERRHYCVVLKRRPDVTRAEFLALWLGEHRALALQLPGVLDAVFMPTAEDDEVDGVGLLSFASPDDLRHALSSDVAKQLRAHTATFSDSDAAVRVVLCDGESVDSVG
jgi:hypothetical protein